MSFKAVENRPTVKHCQYGHTLRCRLRLRGLMSKMADGTGCFGASGVVMTNISRGDSYEQPCNKHGHQGAAQHSTPLTSASWRRDRHRTAIDSSAVCQP
jgi:hypothetical protein